jgi:hypothetical protein
MGRTTLRVRPDLSRGPAHVEGIRGGGGAVTVTGWHDDEEVTSKNFGYTMTKTPLIIGGGGGCERKMNGWMRDGQRHGYSDGAGPCGKTLSP